MKNTQPGITPPAPGQEKEEPDLWHEDDIPSDDKASASDSRDAGSKPERGERDD
jgi:hypothetical protein